MNDDSVREDSAPQQPPTSGSHQLLSFDLGGQAYGIDIRKVQEVRSYVPPVRIPSSPPAFLGVTSLRGQVMPVFDLRTHLGLPDRFDDRPVTAVLGWGARTAGIVVDAVSDVLEIPAEDVQPVPLNAEASTAYVLGVASVQRNAQSQSLIVLDPEALVASLRMRPRPARADHREAT